MVNQRILPDDNCICYHSAEFKKVQEDTTLHQVKSLVQVKPVK